MSTLKSLRNKIDKIDESIVKKLVARKKLSKKIGQIKLKNKVKVIDKKREKELLALHDQLALHYQLSSAFIRRLFKIIILDSRKSQK